MASASDHVDPDRYFSNICLERTPSTTEFVLRRDLDHLAAGTIVYSDGLHRGGRRACRLTRRAGPVFYVPQDELEPYVRSWEPTCLMPHDPEL